MIGAVWLPDRQAQTATGETTTIVIVTWDDEEDRGTAWTPDGESVAVTLVGRRLSIQDTLDLTPIENEIIASMRACIEAMDSDQAQVRDKYDAAHHLFGSHLTAWSEEFGNLYNSMLEVYRAKTPQPRGHYRTRSTEISYSTFQTQVWVDDKVQPPIPSAEELLERFDARIRVYREVAADGQRHDSVIWLGPGNHTPRCTVNLPREIGPRGGSLPSAMPSRVIIDPFVPPIPVQRALVVRREVQQ